MHHGSQGVLLREPRLYILNKNLSLDGMVCTLYNTPYQAGCELSSTHQSGQKCGSGETKIADALGLHDKCDRRNPGMEYCCKLNGLPKPLTNCHWVGQGGCADNTCSDTEVTLETDNVGDNGLTACLCQ